MRAYDLFVVPVYAGDEDARSLGRCGQGESLSMAIIPGESNAEDIKREEDDESYDYNPVKAPPPSS